MQYIYIYSLDQDGNRAVTVIDETYSFYNVICVYNIQFAFTKCPF